MLQLASEGEITTPQIAVSRHIRCLIIVVVVVRLSSSLSFNRRFASSSSSRDCAANALRRSSSSSSSNIHLTHSSSSLSCRSSGSFALFQLDASWTSPGLRRCCRGMRSRKCIVASRNRHRSPSQPKRRDCNTRHSNNCRAFLLLLYPFSVEPA